MKECFIVIVVKEQYEFIKKMVKWKLVKLDGPNMQVFSDPLTGMDIAIVLHAWAAGPVKWLIYKHLDAMNTTEGDRNYERFCQLFLKE